MITKELLSDVYPDWKVVKITDNWIDFDDGYSFTRIRHCIHKVANACKEWIIGQGCKKVYSGIYNSTDQSKLYICMLDSMQYAIADFCADTEPEAIFQACQYILDNER